MQAEAGVAVDRASLQPYILDIVRSYGQEQLPEGEEEEEECAFKASLSWISNLLQVMDLRSQKIIGSQKPEDSNKAQELLSLRYDAMGICLS